MVRLSQPDRGARWQPDLVLIDRERLLRGWTRGELARRAHVDAGTISDMFRGRRRPVLGTIQAICLSLGLELRDVLLFEDDRNEDRWVPAA